VPDDFNVQNWHTGVAADAHHQIVAYPVRAIIFQEANQEDGLVVVRKPKLTPHQKVEALERMGKGATTRDLAKGYGVSVSTISRLAA
jgi:hypothetical protein